MPSNVVPCANTRRLKSGLWSCGLFSLTRKVGPKSTEIESLAAFRSLKKLTLVWGMKIMKGRFAAASNGNFPSAHNPKNVV